MNRPTERRKPKFRLLVAGSDRAPGSVDGTWRLETESPTGLRKSKLTLAAVGSTLTGEQSADGRSGPIFSGTVSGSAVAWRIQIVHPVRLTLAYNGVVRGDTMMGTVKAGDRKSVV